MKTEMQKWAEDRVDKLAEESYEIEKILKLAKKDLNSIMVGRPNDACRQRFCDWAGLQPKKT